MIRGYRADIDLDFDKAAAQLLEWAKAEKRPKTAASYRECITQLKRSFAGRRRHLNGRPCSMTCWAPMNCACATSPPAFQRRHGLRR